MIDKNHLKTLDKWDLKLYICSAEIHRMKTILKHSLIIDLPQVGILCPSALRIFFCGAYFFIWVDHLKPD